MVLLCRCCHWHSRCPLAACLAQVSARQGVSPAVLEVWVSPLLPHLRRVSVSLRLGQAVEADERRLVGVEVALVSLLRDRQREPTPRQNGRGALQATTL